MVPLDGISPGTPTINYYGCVRCQKQHLEYEDVYKEHIMFQSKHGIQKMKVETAIWALLNTKNDQEAA